MEEDKNNRENILELKMKEILALDQKFSQVVESEILSRKDGENRLLRLLDDKFNLIKSEIGREGKLRAESIEQLNQCLEVIYLIFFYFYFISSIDIHNISIRS